MSENKHRQYLRQKLRIAHYASHVPCNYLCLCVENMVLVFSLDSCSAKFTIDIACFFCARPRSNPDLHFNLEHFAFTACVLVYVHSKSTGGIGDLNLKSRAHLYTQV